MLEQWKIYPEIPQHNFLLKKKTTIIQIEHIHSYNLPYVTVGKQAIISKQHIINIPDFL
jgi:DNA topoisomerase VI subunit B